MAKRSKYFRQNWFIINRFKTVTFNPFCTDDKSKGSLLSFHCVKSVQIRSFFWLEYRKTRTRKNSVYTDFSRSVIFITADCDITRNSSETYKGKTELQEKWTQRKKKRVMRSTFWLHSLLPMSILSLFSSTPLLFF